MSNDDQSTTSPFTKLLSLDETSADFLTELRQINTATANQFQFGPIPDRLLAQLISTLTSNSSADLSAESLILLKTLSRDKSLSNLFTNTDLLHHLKMLLETTSSLDLTIHTLRCLANMLFNSVDTRQLAISDPNLLPLLINIHLDIPNGNTIKNELALKILFVLTVFHKELTYSLNTSLTFKSPPKRLLDYLAEALDASLQLDTNQTEVRVEALKVVYNLTGALDVSTEATTCAYIVSVLRDILVYGDSEKVTAQIVNALTNMPIGALERLVVDVGSVGDEVDAMRLFRARYDTYQGEFSFYGPLFVEPLHRLLEFMRLLLERYFFGDGNVDALQPVLLLLGFVAKARRAELRRYLRLRVLPPLRDEVLRLPTEGRTLRSLLTRLMTHSSLQIKRLSAQLMFALCKQDTARLIKYTGFGNAAGLLTELGLLVAAREPTGADDDDDEESDTEEYARLRPNVNLVTGRYEPRMHESPLEGYSDEQKESMAHELMKLFDKLNAVGVIRPAVIDERTGQARPVEHVLELAEKINEQHKSIDSDKNGNNDDQ